MLQVILIMIRILSRSYVASNRAAAETLRKRRRRRRRRRMRRKRRKRRS